MDGDELRKQPGQHAGFDLELDGGWREELLVKLIVGQTIGVAFLVAVTAIGGLLGLLPLGGIALFTGLVAYALLRRGLFRVGGYVFLVGTCIAVTANVFLRGYQDASAIYYLWPILTAMALMGTGGGVALVALSAVLYLLLVFVQRAGLQSPPLLYDPQKEALLTVGSRLMMFFLLSFLTWLVGQNLARALRRAWLTAQRWRELNETLEQRVALRTRRLQAATEVSRAMTSVLDLGELLPQVVDLVRERFDLYYVGLFLVDEAGEWAVLRAGTGEAGRAMLARGHRVRVGEGMVGWSIANAQARISLEDGEGAVRLATEELPDTRSEAVLPLRSRGRVLGALTVRSTQLGAFDEAAISVLQTLADQVAVAVDNARLFAETQAALAEAEATHRRYLSRAWTEYLESMRTTGYEATGPGAEPLGDAVVSEVQEVVRRGEMLVVAGDGEAEGRSALVAPITLRGAVIGALGIHDEDGERRWTDDEVALVEQISERVALAAENLRLFEETRRRAAREQLVAEIGSRVRASLDADVVLKTAVRELGHALGARLVAVEMTGPGGDGDGLAGGPASATEVEG